MPRHFIFALCSLSLVLGTEAVTCGDVVAFAEDNGNGCNGVKIPTTDADGNIQGCTTCTAPTPGTVCTDAQENTQGESEGTCLKWNDESCNEFYDTGDLNPQWVRNLAFCPVRCGMCTSAKSPLHQWHQRTAMAGSNYCPDTHRYAYHDGSHCCRQDIDGNFRQDPRDVGTCTDGDSIVCPTGPEDGDEGCYDAPIYEDAGTCGYLDVWTTKCWGVDNPGKTCNVGQPGRGCCSCKMPAPGTECTVGQQDNPDGRCAELKGPDLCHTTSLVSNMANCPVTCGACKTTITLIQSSQNRVDDMVATVPKILAGVDALKHKVKDDLYAQEFLLNGAFGTQLKLTALANEMDAFGSNACPDETGHNDITSSCLCGGQVFCDYVETGVSTKCVKKPDEDPVCTVTCKTGGIGDKILIACTCGDDATTCGGLDNDLLASKRLQWPQNGASAHDPSWCYSFGVDVPVSCQTIPPCGKNGTDPNSCDIGCNCEKNNATMDCFPGDTCTTTGGFETGQKGVLQLAGK